MMAEQHPFVGGHIIEPVIAPDSRRGARIVEAERLFGDELAVEAVSDEIDANGGGHEPERVDCLAAI